jgi:TM2 domain-containing membrane protein YozV
MNRKQKSKGLAYVLWFFLGVLGIHRFYSGQTGYAVCMLIFGWATLGIWPLLDVFFIGRGIEQTNEAIELNVIQQIKAVK